MSPGQNTILVIDDAGLVRAYYRTILGAAGFRVLEALNGLEALETLLITTVDLLIVDINMPQMDGFSFLRVLRQKERALATIPALIISTQSQEADLQAARAAGANYYLVKPIERGQLTEFAAMLCGIEP
jgi:two-component system chemotaxis response regulator CheY